MLIAHLNKRYWPHIGGIERFLHDLATATAAAGNDVKAYVCAPAPRTSRARVDGVDVIGAPTFGVVQSQPISPTYPLLPGAADVWHLHEPFPLGTLTAALRPRGGRRLVVTWHSEVVRQKRLRPLYTLLARRVLARADAIHVATRSHLERYGTLHPFAAKVHVIPFLVDVRRAIGSRDHSLAQRISSFAAGEPVVLTVARLVYYKGIDVLLEAMSAVPRGRLVIVGDGPLRPSLEAKAAKVGVAGRVLWLGTVADEELAAAYAASDLFVLPSVAVSEAFGIVQVEAMAAGLPVVSTKLGTGVDEVNRNGETGILVRPGDATELASALGRLIADPGLRRYFASRALEHAGRFAPDVLLPRYRELYAGTADASR